jgi:hypothetical protein
MSSSNAPLQGALVFSGRELDVSFKMTRPLTDFMATLHKNGLEEKRLSKYVSHRTNADNIVTLSVTFPEEGQYGMDIYTREVNSSIQNGNDTNGGSGSKNGNSEKHLLTHCCKYLINSTRK